MPPVIPPTVTISAPMVTRVADVQSVSQTPFFTNPPFQGVQNSSSGSQSTWVQLQDWRQQQQYQAPLINTSTYLAPPPNHAYAGWKNSANGGFDNSGWFPQAIGPGGPPGFISGPTSQGPDGSSGGGGLPLVSGLGGGSGNFPGGSPGPFYGGSSGPPLGGPPSGGSPPGGYISGN